MHCPFPDLLKNLLSGTATRHARDGRRRLGKVPIATEPPGAPGQPNEQDRLRYFSRLRPRAPRCKALGGKPHLPAINKTDGRPWLVQTIRTVFRSLGTKRVNEGISPKG